MRVVHVAELGLAAALRHDLAVDEGGLTGDSLPGSVGMPRERALVGMASVRPAVLVQVREAIELREPVGVILVHDMDLHLAEAPGELDLPGGRQFLRRKEQDLVAEERPIKALKKGFVHAARQIDAGNLCAEPRRQRANGEGPALAAQKHRPRSSGRHGLLKVLIDSRNTTKSDRSAAVSRSGPTALEPLSE